MTTQNTKCCEKCLGEREVGVSQLSYDIEKYCKNTECLCHHQNSTEEKKRGECNICGEETDLYCKSCEDKEEDFRLWYCEKHYQSVILTGNCCSGNEKIYGGFSPL